MMVVVSRADPDAPRALTLCVPITTAYRESEYEVELPPRAFLRQKSYANVQGLQTVQDHELNGPIGTIPDDALQRIRRALRYILEL